MSGGIVLTTVKVAFQLRFDRIPLSAFPQPFLSCSELGSIWVNRGTCARNRYTGPTIFLKRMT